MDNKPLIPDMVCDVNQYQQTGISLMLTYLAAMTCAVESYILSADLRPSAVAVVKADSDLFRAGDLVITEKTAHRVLRFEPEPQWRDWLSGEAGSAAVESG